MPPLTESFHVLIKVLAVDQFPGGTEGVNHGEGFSRWQSNLQKHAGQLRLLRVLCPHLCYYSAPYHHGCVWGGGARLPIGSGDSL